MLIFFHKARKKVGCKPLNLFDNRVNNSKKIFGRGLLKNCSRKVHQKLMSYPYLPSRKVIPYTKGRKRGITFRKPFPVSFTTKMKM